MKAYPDGARAGGVETASTVRERSAGAEALFSLAQGEARGIADALEPEDRTAFARGFCTTVLTAYWRKRSSAAGCDWGIREPVVPPRSEFAELANRQAHALLPLAGPRAGFLLGQLYTTLLPDGLRKELGAFYTPPPLVARLMDLATSNGFDWRRGRVIDPACGGAAFLAAVAPRLAQASTGRTPAAILDDIERRLTGIEVDPYSAWMAMVLLDLALLPLAMRANRRPRGLVVAGDAFEIDPVDLGQFELVIGNPPYGKVTLSATMRERFRRTLFGHANLYGLFTELAVQLARDGGLVAYVTPTSFLGGEYFKQLRAFLCANAPLVSSDFVEQREGVFEGVLQETLLAVYRKGTTPASTSRVEVSLLQMQNESESAGVLPIGCAQIATDVGRPWILPREPSQAVLVRQLNAMPHRLADYGFAVSTGPLVWNRHKDQLRLTLDTGCYPIIWAEAVSANGTFQFQAARRNHLPYLWLKDRQDFLIHNEPCILLQRTTAKEQRRRLIAAVIPNSFIVEYPGFSVENHLNMISATSAQPTVALSTLAALLNSAAVDRAFRCISGSVAVSAYELNNLPLPAPAHLHRIQDAVFSDVTRQQLEDLIEDCYRSVQRVRRVTAADRTVERHREMVA